jgi:hypothetical protein
MLRVHRRRSRIHRASFVLALVAGAVLLTAGCGSGSDTKPPLSKRVYIERFNDVQQDAPKVFANVSEATRDPKAAQPHLDAFDRLIADLDALEPPPTWRDEHRQMLASLRTMRASIDVLSRAPAGKVAVVQTQLQRYKDAEATYGEAVEHVNASR